MKKEMRIVGIDDASFDKFKDKRTLIVGTIFRGGSFMDGVITSKVSVDGNNSTKKIAEMVNNCKFRPQLQAILLDGIAVAGFNVVNVERLQKETGLPVIVIMRNYPNFRKIEAALKKIGKEKKMAIIKKAGPIHKVKKIHIQICGIELEKAKKIIEITSTRSFIPEPIRAAHIIGSGISYGESKGKA